MRRSIYLILGLISLVLTYIGIALPGVPAIPFILLALYFFSQSSETWVKKLEQGKITGKIVHKIHLHRTKRWFIWFVISQYLISMIVAERLAIHTFWWSLLWYLFVLSSSILLYMLLKKQQVTP